MIRVAIVEDRPEISSGISYIISLNDGFSSEIFTNAEAALRAVTPQRFDVVIMDIKLPGMSGIECTQLLKQKYPELKIMMCTVFEDDEKIFRAISAGADGYILKRTEPNNLIQSIRELMEGGSPISGYIAKKILKGFRQTMPQDMDENPLSEREQEVLSLLASGYRNKEVADKLSVSPMTIKSHIYNIYQKLHVTSRVEAINKFRSKPKG
ncbi:MAG TPA: response regulator transcription factor [Bacteroidia bacterium]|nr:response regulator transcription factor [Bacteroidia bacterium]